MITQASGDQNTAMAAAASSQQSATGQQTVAAVSSFKAADANV